ncbi:hypothetical protein [Sphingomonas sp.]|uniref:hypothetical protein n=1 Tax=Sphingomonas sp. TaxID=28214 RepID=UPI003D6CEA9B
MRWGTGIGRHGRGAVHLPPRSPSASRGCVRDSYAGISLKPGGAPADLQRLAERALTGDKQAQLELGERYEEGRGVIPDRKRARHLYGLAATTTGGTIYVYVPPAKKGGNGYTMPVSMGPVVQGLAEAKARLRALRSASRQQE